MQKTAPSTVASGWGGKNRILFFTGTRSLRSRSYASGGARYLQADLMLLTHARCALKDPHGCFGISMNPALRCREQGQSREMKSLVARLRRTVRFVRESCSVSPWTLHSFALLRYAVIASTEQLPFGLGAAAENVRVESEGKITCTARPDETGARNGRLQPSGCARTGSLHARGMHESDGCNGSRLPAMPDTSRCPQPWRSG